MEKENWEGDRLWYVGGFHRAWCGEWSPSIVQAVHISHSQTTTTRAAVVVVVAAVVFQHVLHRHGTVGRLPGRRQFYRGLSSECGARRMAAAEPVRQRAWSQPCQEPAADQHASDAGWLDADLRRYWTSDAVLWTSFATHRARDENQRSHRRRHTTGY